MDRRGWIKNAMAALLGIVAPWRKARRQQKNIKEAWIFYHWDRAGNLVDKYMIDLVTCRSKNGRLSWEQATARWEEITKHPRFCKARSKKDEYYYSSRSKSSVLEEIRREGGDRANFLRSSLRCLERECNEPKKLDEVCRRICARVIYPKGTEEVC